MQENTGITESASSLERTELIRGLIRIKNLEERPRKEGEVPDKVILLGGGGITPVSAMAHYLRKRVCLWLQ